VLGLQIPAIENRMPDSEIKKAPTIDPEKLRIVETPRAAAEW
jgi:hypothetical protein